MYHFLLHHIEFVSRSIRDGIYTAIYNIYVYTHTHKH